MSSGPALYSREYWLERAEETRTVAELMSNPDARRQMFGIVESYVRLADHASEKAVAPKERGWFLYRRWLKALFSGRLKSLALVYPMAMILSGT
jgi:hypothetical protein